MEKTAKRERQSNFELLRIIAMLMIIAHHLANNADSFNSYGSLLNSIWLDSLLPIGKIGVDIFVLISGYFLSKSSKLTVKKIAKFWGQVFFYSVFIYIIFVLVKEEEWSLTAFFNFLFPLIREEWWFASSYFIMFLLSPLFNYVIEAITGRQHIIILIGGFIFWSIIPTFCEYDCYINEVLWFTYLYFVSAYIRKYADNVKFSSIKCLTAAIVLWMASFVIESLFPGIFVFFPKFSTHNMNTMFVFLSSVLIFVAFKNLNIGKSKIINTIASATFGVYLIHDSNLVRDVLWNDIFGSSLHQNSNILIPYTAFVVIIVFVTASTIDIIRINTAEKLFMKFVDKAEPKLKKAVSSLLEIIVKAMKCCGTVLKKRASNNIDK